MPGGSQITRGNEILYTMIYLPSVAVPNVNANTSGNQTVTVNGVQVGDLISWNQIGTIVGLAVDNIYVSAANTLIFYWTNNTTGNITGSANQAFLLSITRADIVPYTSLPAALE